MMFVLKFNASLAGLQNLHRFFLSKVTLVTSVRLVLKRLYYPSSVLQHCKCDELALVEATVAFLVSGVI